MDSENTLLPEQSDNSFEAVEEAQELVEEACKCTETECIDNQSDVYIENSESDADQIQLPSKEDLEKKNKLKKRRKIFKILYIIMLGLAVFLTSVAMLVGLIALIDEDFEWDYSPNMDEVGEDFVITDFTDSDIVRNYDNFIADEHRFVGGGFEYSGADYKYSKYDREETYFEATELNGLKTISATYVNGSKLVLSIDSTASTDSSKLKIVVTSSSDGEIVGTYSINERHYIVLEPERATTYFVKIVGEDADIKITVNRMILGIDEAPTT